MKKIVMIFTILLMNLLLFSTSLFNKNIHYENTLIVCFRSDVIENKTNKINFYQVDGKISTGISQFDSIAAEYKISEMEQMFPSLKNKDWKDTNGAFLQNVYRLKLESIKKIEQLLSELKQSKFLVYAEYEAIMRYTYTPNDPMFDEQWFHQNIQSEEAWNYLNSNEEVLIAICDSGVKWNHPDLQNNIWVNEAELDDSMTINWATGTISGGNGIDDDENGFIDDVIGWCFVDGEAGNDSFQPLAENGHGTHVAGCAGAVGDNNIGVVGSSGPFSNIKLIPLRHASNSVFSPSVENGPEGIVYAADIGADIVNCSWVGQGNGALLTQVVNYATDSGTLVIAAAGNGDTLHNQGNIFYPADCENALCVAATDMNDEKADFSDYGEPIDISTPGVNILSTVIEDEYNVPDSYMNASGTSMAAPITSGVAAMVKAINPDFGPNEIRQILQNTADNIDEQNPSYNGLLGAGRLNSFNALMFGQIPNITVYSYNLSEYIPENGIPEVNEELSLDIAIYNETNWLDAEDITVILSSSLTSIEIIESVLTFSFLSNGDFVWNEGDGFKLIYTDEELESLPLTLTITANQELEIPYETEIDLEIPFSFEQAGWPITTTEPLESSPLILDLNGDEFAEIIYGDAEGNVQVKMFNGTDVNGFPVNISDDQIKGAIAAGDIDNDGFIELVISTWQDGIKVINNDGSELFTADINGFVVANPVVADIDGDENLEIIAVSLTGALAVFDNSGNNFGDFPITLTAGSFSPMTVGDLNNDGISDIVVSLTNGDLVVISGSDATILPGFPYDAGSPSEKGPVLADIDNDNIPEIICANNSNEIFALNNDGSMIFSNNFGVIKTSVVVAEITGDNNPDIIFANEEGELYLLDNAGNVQPNFPINTGAEVTATPILADLQPYGICDIIFGDADGFLHAIGTDGMEADGYPLEIGENISISAALGDSDNDGDIDITVADEASVHLIDYNLSADIVWNCFRGNPGRTGYEMPYFTSVNNQNFFVSPILRLNNYPNPFNPTTTISFELTTENAENAIVSIYNIKGQKVKQFSIDEGRSSIEWNGKDENNKPVSSGIYFYRLQTSRFSQSKKMILLK